MSQPIQPIQPIVSLPAECASQMVYLSTQLQDTAIAYGWLQYQVKQRQLREQAYIDVLVNNKRTYVPGRNGVFQELLDSTGKV